MIWQKKKKVKSIAKGKPKRKYHKCEKKKKKTLKTEQGHDEQDRETANKMDWKFLKNEIRVHRILKEEQRDQK